MQIIKDSLKSHSEWLIVWTLRLLFSIYNAFQNGGF